MFRSWPLALATLSVLSCRSAADHVEDAGTLVGVDASALDPDSAFEAPRTNLVPRVGRDDTIDLAAWNVENFPQAATTPRLLADLIASLDLDLVAVQEIADTAAFDELVGRLPRHDAVLSSHTYGNGSYQKVGFVYRTDLLEVTGASLLFENMGYTFPRPPLRVNVTIRGSDPVIDFVAIVVHLKAGVDRSDRERRTQAIIALDTYVRGVVDNTSETDVMLLGDFNERLTTSSGQRTMAPLLTATERYTVHTLPLAQAGTVTFLPAGIMLDHVVSTSSLSDEFRGETAVVPPLDQQFSGYETLITDHLPAIIALPIAPP